MAEDILKIIVLGEMDTGKTSLIERFYLNKFKTKNNTIGVDFRMIKETI
jgi:GTPase SAR1 family protein